MSFLIIAVSTHAAGFGTIVCVMVAYASTKVSADRSICMIRDEFCCKPARHSRKQLIILPESEQGSCHGKIRGTIHHKHTLYSSDA